MVAPPASTASHAQPRRIPRTVVAFGIGLAAIMIGVNGLALWMFMATEDRHVEGDLSESTQHTIDGDIVVLDPMTTTLGDAQMHHARITMAVVLHENTRPDRIQARVPLLQDALLLELSQVSGTQLRTVDGSTALRHAMTGHAAAIWGEDKVVRVIFTEMLVN